MRKKIHMINRNGVYYFRRRIPKDLVYFQYKMNTWRKYVGKCHISHRGVTVGYSYFKVGSEAYLIKDIISAEERILKPNRILARLLVFAGLPLILCRGLYPVLGLALMLTGLFIGRAARIRYALVVDTRAGEYIPLISENSLDITNVLNALNVALVMGGGAR